MSIRDKTKNCNIKLKNIAVFLFVVLLSSCGLTKFDESAKYKIKYLDEFILENNLSFNTHEIGGLSGIDFNGNDYVVISDKSKKPELYSVNINIENDNIHSIEFNNRIILKCNSVEIFDAESIRFLPNSDYLVSTEGSINSHQNPEILHINSNGECTKNYSLPSHFQLNSFNKPRHNGVFEGLTVNSTSDGFWVINEIPLKEDGKKPKLINTHSPVRLSHYNLNESQPNFQFSYDLERLIKIPLLPFAINGATEILQLDSNHILVLERSYSAGHKTNGNRVKLFLINLKEVKNTLEINSLKRSKEFAVDKILVFDSKKIKNELKYNLIDNIEGLTFGPELKNGNKSLILMSDNNFSSLGKQFNQFILLELINTNY